MRNNTTIILYKNNTMLFERLERSEIDFFTSYSMEMAHNGTHRMHVFTQLTNIR